MCERDLLSYSAPCEQGKHHYYYCPQVPWEGAGASACRLVGRAKQEPGASACGGQGLGVESHRPHLGWPDLWQGRKLQYTSLSPAPGTGPSEQKVLRKGL